MRGGEARYLQRRRSLRAGPARAERPPPPSPLPTPSPPPPQLPRAAPHVTRARAGGGAVAGPAPGVLMRRPTRVRVRGGCRGDQASVELPTTRGLVSGERKLRLPDRAGGSSDPAEPGVRYIRDKHVPRGLGGRGGRADGAGLRAGAGRGGVGGRPRGRGPTGPQGRCRPPPQGAEGGRWAAPSTTPNIPSQR